MPPVASRAVLSQTRLRSGRPLLLVIVLSGIAAAQVPAFMPYGDARPVFASLREDLWPAAFRGSSESARAAAWPAWAPQRDAEVRARVNAGEEDSIVHLLLFGTTFTTAPRATARDLTALAARPAEAISSLKTRFDDFVAGLAAPGGNERLRVANHVIERAGVDPSDRAVVRRYLERRAAAVGQAGAAQLAAMLNAPAGVSTIYRERGLSSDTAMAIDLGVERALEDLRANRLFESGSIRRVAIVGPGLDFVDKQNGYDFYPQQTIQPFAVVDSLLRLGLASPNRIEVTAFDVSPRVLAHIDAARAAAAAGRGYSLLLPRDLERPWTPALAAYWQRLGSEIGTTLGTDQAPAPPPSAGRVAVRGVVIRPDVVSAVSARDLDIVLQRFEPGDSPFDLVVATNILLYYDVFEQSLALANIARLLRPGGVLLSNNRLVELPGSPMLAAGFTDTTYVSLPDGDTGDRVYWYQRPHP